MVSGSPYYFQSLYYSLLLNLYSRSFIFYYCSSPSPNSILPSSYYSHCSSFFHCSLNLYPIYSLSHYYYILILYSPYSTHLLIIYVISQSIYSHSIIIILIAYSISLIPQSIYPSCPPSFIHNLISSLPLLHNLMLINFPIHIYHVDLYNQLLNNNYFHLLNFSVKMLILILDTVYMIISPTMYLLLSLE